MAMNLAALPELLLSWVRNQGSTLLQGGQDKPAATFQPGAQYEGKVLDQLTNGRHLVQVAGQKLDMNLPGGTRAGDTVRLTFVNSGPRPTFLLNQITPSAPQQVQLSNTAQQVNALVRFAQTAPVQAAAPLLASPPVAPAGRGAPVGTPTATPASSAGAPATSARASPVSAVSVSATSVSATSVTAATVVNAAGKPVIAAAATTTSAPPASASPAASASASTASAASTPTTASTPSASVPATPAAHPAAAANPGAALAGARPIVSNLAMVQGYGAATPAPAGAASAMNAVPAGALGANSGMLGQAVDGLRGAIPTGTTLKPNVVAELPVPSRHLLPIRLSQTVSESGLFYEAHLARWTRGQLSFDALLREPQAQLGRAGQPLVQVADLGMPEQAAHLAGRQLGMLEGMPFQWQGLAWPGQWMQWLVQERPGGGEGEGGSSEETPQWVTELRLTMPRMGQVSAHLSLSGDRLGIRLSAPDAATRDEMRAALPLLLEGLAGAGLEAASVSVETQAVTHASA